MIGKCSLLALCIVAVTSLGGCKSESPPPTAESEPAGETAVAAEPEPELAGAPKIAAAEPVFDFGAIKPTDKVEHVFKIHNAGTADLKIERVQRT